jgi:hypothetical protein
MGFAAPLMAIAGIAGAGISAYGAYEGAQANAASAAYQSQVAKNNALIANQNAAWAAQAGSAKEAAQGMKNAAAVGSLKAKQAASGIDVNSGSSANVAAAASELGELDLMTTRSNAARDVYGYEVQSTSDTAQSQLLQSQSQNYSNMAPLSALGTFLSGASSVGGKYAGWNSNFGGGGSSSGNTNVLGF